MPLKKTRGSINTQVQKNILARWKEQQMRIDSGKEIATLLNSDQPGRNPYYVSALIDVVDFLAENQLPFRGSCDAFDDMVGDGKSGTEHFKYFKSGV